MIACPHDVIGYDHETGGYKPFHLEEELGPDDCIHGEKGCTSLHPGLPPLPRLGARGRRAPLRPRRASPTRCRASTKDILLTRATDDMVHEMGQDGGLVSAMLIWALEQGYIDAALVSFLEGDGTHVEGHPGRGPHQGGDPRLRRQPLHLLGQHPGLSSEALERGLLEARPRRHELPVVGRRR